MVESFHLDTVMALMMHVGQRDGVSHSGLNMRYFAILVVSAIAIGLVGLYLFMAHCVARLTEAYRSAVVVQLEDMKSLRCRFWLEDKRADGCFFQRHFNLLLLLKDVYISATLYCLYEQPLFLVVMLVLLQLPLSALTFRYPPYRDSKENVLLCISQCLYSVLNLLFLLNVAAGRRMSAQTRYYVVGFLKIAVVLAIILAHICFSLFKSFQSIRSKCKSRRRVSTVSVARDANDLSNLQLDQSIEKGDAAKNNSSLKKKSSKSAKAINSLHQRSVVPDKLISVDSNHGVGSSLLEGDVSLVKIDNTLTSVEQDKALLANEPSLATKLDLQPHQDLVLPATSGLINPPQSKPAKNIRLSHKKKLIVHKVDTTIKTSNGSL